jgi:hypothetical protein
MLMRDCETQAFEQSILYDSIGTDVLFSRFRIRVVSTLVGVVDRDFSGEHAVTTVEPMQELQARVQEVRRDGVCDALGLGYELKAKSAKWGEY